MNAAKFSLHLCFCVNIIDKSLLHLFLSEDAAILGGYGAAGLILDAPDRHAEVFGFDQNSDILGLQRFFKFICNLKSQTLLHLRAAGVVIHNSVDFRSEEHTSELQSRRDLPYFPTRRSSDLLKTPPYLVVTVLLALSLMPRIDTQRCLASIRTATSSVSSDFLSSSAI